VNTFKEYTRKKGVARHKRDNIGVSNATNPNMKHAADVVPVCHRVDNNAVQEFEQLKRMQRGTKTINLQKARKLKDQFKLKGFSGVLGNTGIQLAPHQESGFFVLIKR